MTREPIEASAEALRSRDELEVGETGEHLVEIVGVFKTNGACRVRLLEGDREVVSGKITDPALATPGNAYTTALDQGRPLLVMAKPTLKDGAIHRLFISDAQVAP
jgi:hypothetical protein